jgi:serine/threonine protein kinase
MPLASTLSDDELRLFLLGDLSEERVEYVRAWLDADPAHAERLARFQVQDDLVVAVRGGVSEAPAPQDAAIERIVRGVASALEKMPEQNDETASCSELAETPEPAAGPEAVEESWPPRLGEYRVVREIGRGGMGVVLEVAHDILNRPAAAKVLMPRLVRQPKAIARFLREARAAAAVEHDHVVPIWHVGAEDGKPYIVMPLLKGESLDRLVKRQGALPPAEVVRIGREIAAGLDAAHRRGLVHRDMKPANVWIDEGSGRARVLDFGLARLEDGTDALSQTDAIQGTPAYMASELLDGHPADVRSDLFALGAILYECATGRRAFPGATVTAILKAVATHDPAPPAAVNPDVSADLSALIMKLLAKDPTQRFASAAEVASALAVLTPAQQPSHTTNASHARDPKARKARRRLGLLTAGSGLLGLILLGATLRSCSRPEDVARAPTPPTATTPSLIDHVSVRARGEAESAPMRHRGKVDVLVERVRDGRPQLLRLDEPGALPLTADDGFRIEGEVDPPAYLYMVWVDPDHDVTPVFPWDPAAKPSWHGTRPAVEEPSGRVSLPRNKGDRWRAPKAKPGVATMVLFARPTPLDVPDEVLEQWFKSLPELPLPPDGDGAAVWFDDYSVVNTDPSRRRGFVLEKTNDPFARWQGQLQRSLGEKASFETAVSFARAGGK